MHCSRAAHAFGRLRRRPLRSRDAPLFLNDTVAPLNMLVIGRDHKLYYEAYNDASDLDGDGMLDVELTSPTHHLLRLFRFEEVLHATAAACFDPVPAPPPSKTCSGQWSGDWLNYVTTSRIDALRKVLYGGLRSTDTDAATRCSSAPTFRRTRTAGARSTRASRVDGYDIRDYTPLPLPTPSPRHLFANTTLRADADEYPLLRVLQNQKDASAQPLKASGTG